MGAVHVAAPGRKTTDGAWNAPDGERFGCVWERFVSRADDYAAALEPPLVNIFRNESALIGLPNSHPWP